MAAEREIDIEIEVEVGMKRVLVNPTLNRNRHRNKNRATTEIEIEIWIRLINLTWNGVADMIGANGKEYENWYSPAVSLSFGLVWEFQS